MTDVFSKQKRSEIMSRIKGRGNVATEIRMIKIFRENGITGWRRHSEVIGKPDIVFHKIKLAVFVDGCFWHGCPRHGALPVTNRRFWTNKIQKNKTRDRLVNRILKAKGWKVLRIWQHALSNSLKVARRIQFILKN